MANQISESILTDALIECDELSEFYEYDIDSEEFIRALNKVENFTISISKADTLEESMLEELNLLLKHMKNLKRLGIFNRAGERIDVTSIFEHISSEVEVVRIRGMNLTHGISEDVANRLKKLQEFTVSKCNIPRIPVFSKDGCKITLYEGITEISDRECIDYAMDSKVNNRLNVSGRDEVTRLLGVMEGKPLPLELYKKYKEFTDKFDSICISIKNVNHLSLEQLEELESDKHIKNIAVEGGFKSADKNSWYSLEEYKLVRGEIDKIVTKIKLPNQDDKDREKKIFAQVYKLLGKRIAYDHYAISTEGKLDKELRYNCRNMKNGLLGVARDGKNMCMAVCAGYADILRNVLSCLGIESEYISSMSDKRFFLDKNGAYVPQKDDNGKNIYENGTTDPMGHAYNLVSLDGKKFYCDLTWDADNIKVDRFPLWNFLNSSEFFLRSHDKVGFNKVTSDKDANFSLPFNEQLQLFEEVAKEEISQMIQENYLSGFVSQYLGSIKQGDKAHESQKFLNMLECVKKVEKLILGREENNRTNMGITIGEKSFVLDTGDKLKEMKRDIQTRRLRESGHESR